MHDHNLDDLIIDNIEPKSSKTKSFLTIVALLIVVLIVGIILTKILLKNPNDDKLAFEQNAIEMIAPELKLKEIVKSPEVKKEISLSNITEQEIKAPVVETKKSVTAKEPVVVIQEKRTEEAVKEVVTVKEPKIVIEEEKTEEPVKETVKIIKPIEPEKVKVPMIKASKPMAKPVQEIVVPKPIKKSVVTTHIPATVSTKSYYIQVGSFKKSPSTRFISVIKNTGFNHKITEPDVDGTKKLLIGPYKDRTSVDRALAQVRDRINKSAFVVKR